MKLKYFLIIFALLTSARLFAEEPPSDKLLDDEFSEEPQISTKPSAGAVSGKKENDELSSERDSNDPFGTPDDKIKKPEEKTAEKVEPLPTHEEPGSGMEAARPVEDLPVPENEEAPTGLVLR